jgi:hypothetical protein
MNIRNKLKLYSFNLFSFRRYVLSLKSHKILNTLKFLVNIINDCLIAPPVAYSNIAKHKRNSCKDREYYQWRNRYINSIIGK